MTKAYWVGKFLVDLSRNQISHNQDVQTLPPKALQVLTYLAQNSGRVVSHDELLNQVWANTVVTPNTLQRSIAQLRKAFGETSHASALIKTHAKQGYSLEVEVRWSAGEDTGTVEPAADSQGQLPEVLPVLPPEHTVNVFPQPEMAPPKSKTAKPKHNKLWWYSALAALLVLAVGVLPFVQHEADFQLEDLRYLTATDDKEYGARYSPDGQYILFHRYYEKVCTNHIWAKNADTLQEVQLTAERGTYSGYNLSADGKNLLFVQEQDCIAPVNQPSCFKLMSLDFQAALKEPQQAKELLDCQHSAIRNPIWMDEQHIALMQREDRNWRLVRYSLADQSSSTLYEAKDGITLGLAWSADRQLFAVTSLKSSGGQRLDLLFADGTVKSSHNIVFPPGAPRYTKLLPEFMPDSKGLLLTYRGQLSTLSEQGQIQELNIGLDANIGSPAFHPDGNRLLVVSGRYDSDVARLSIPDEVHIDDPTQDLEAQVFERSINLEDKAKFRPNGQSIAFVSKRTGSEQVWLLENNNAALISSFTKGTMVSNLLWSKDGQSLLVQADMSLYLLSVDKQQRQLHFPHPVLGLYDWDEDAQQVIARVLLNDTSRFVSIDISSMEFQQLNNKRVFWAAQNPGGTLVFMDHLRQFWQRGSIEDKRINALNDQGSSKGFVLTNEQLYGINKNNQLWSYHLQSGAFKVLGNVSPDIEFLTDIQGNEILATLLVGERQEILELTLAD
ncbi:winged helix-turn-helix domain-containing protein [Bowmanella sp. Y26]|uniref:winged helix-turn-helix domain-containing protein n=1 Tax=Bowmanella yangjiangensis TaxID=2811230 RepID=UPI001BDD5EC0|nr:winged helix-turn-helix domain-containing protein [Bowmanella yangjiangensis]MBT1064148.1 winged helix-turn-helix domain-containing protein [Bowmanella yangjiangensis]